jgi:hypothetical protein
LYGLAASATTSAAIRVRLHATRRRAWAGTDGATARQRLYAIKRRDERVPLSISVGDAQVRACIGARTRIAPPEALARSRRCCKDVALYGSAAHLPPGLLEELLPGE